MIFADAINYAHDLVIECGELYFPHKIEAHNAIDMIEATYKSEIQAVAENARLKAANANNPEIERIVRDAVVSYGEMFPSAPNDSAENELCYRAKVANDWLKSIGAEPEPFHYVKEGGAK
jgi:NAD-dependent SIR2 family protein deacetylase